MTSRNIKMCYLISIFVIFLQMRTCLSQATIFFPREEAVFEPPCVAYDGREGLCRLLVRCTTFFSEMSQLSLSPCAITDAKQGVCCPPNKEPTIDPSSVIDDDRRAIHLPGATTEIQNIALQAGIDFAREKEAKEQDLFDRNIIAEQNSPVALHAKLFETNKEILEFTKGGDIILAASANLIKTLNLSKEEVDIGLPSLRIKKAGICPPEPTCPDFLESYRTINGTCNNIEHKNWGRSGQSFKRKIPPHYTDGSSSIRTAVSGHPLPSARLISTSLSPSTSASYDNLTNLIWQWGQFVDHDITLTQLSMGKGNSPIPCCTGGQIQPQRNRHPECMPIEIPPNDNFYSHFQQNCMSFVRSKAASREKCTFGARQQSNAITSYIDASNVYSSTIEQAEKLRTSKGGQLATFNQNGRSLLPANPNSCDKRRQNHCSFVAGDVRLNEQINLAVMHTVWMRQHNAIAAELGRINPIWTDETLYQEARRIVGAQMQHITYNEYLPIVLGREYVENYGLLPQASGYFRGYNPNVDATIFNAFAAAAFRYGHTLITSVLQGFDKFGKAKQEMEMGKFSFRPFSLYEKETLDDLIRGFTKQQSQKMDRFFSDQLTNKLFAQDRQFGMDLVALNIQRGRDHGLPGYTQWQETCNLPPINSWRDLSNVMDPEAISALRNVYDDVHDVDLFIGGVSERIHGNSLLGPTFRCLVGEQFIALKLGDRFFYENGAVGRTTLGSSIEPASSFTTTQLDEIRKTTLSRILCDNSDNVEVMQPLAFVSGRFANKPEDCRADIMIPRMSLEPWANSRVWTK